MRHKNHYSPSEWLKMVYSLAMTKGTYRQCRIIRRPVYIRGGKSIDGARGLSTGRFCRFDLDGSKKTLFIGDNCEFGDNTHIVALNKVQIGNDVLIASKVFISDTNHGYYGGDNGFKTDSPYTKPNERELCKGTVIIGDNVWIGENAVLLAGCSIGDGCIVGANSVITKSIPPGCIVVGINNIIKRYNNKFGIWERLGEKQEEQK